MKTIKAILIDPHAKTVSHCDVELDAHHSSYEGLRDLIFKYSEGKGLLQAVNVGGNHSLYIDEEGLLMDWDSQAFFSMGRAAQSMTLAGVAVLMSDTIDGDTGPCTIPIEFVQAVVRWMPPSEVRVPAPYMETMNDDGSVNREYIAGVQEWTYENQP